MHEPRRFWPGCFALTLVLGCSANEGRVERSDPLTAATGTSTSATDPSTGGATADPTPRMDLGAPPELGCDAVDLLFVVDNSAGMLPYQQALADVVGAFAGDLLTALPEGTSVHVGVTTTEFDYGCTAPETSVECQTTADAEEVGAHYLKPSEVHDGGEGSQGRLREFDGERYFTAQAGDEHAGFVAWLSGAIVAVGEEGCSFEMPSAATGWATHPANEVVNGGFLRDAGSVLLVVVLTDEPDKSPDVQSVYGNMILAAKTACGGAACVRIAGLGPACVPQTEQRLWEFMQLFADDKPAWGDVQDTEAYAEVLGEGLVQEMTQACATIPSAG